MSKPDSTYRRTADSTFDPERLVDAAAVAERVLDEWRHTGVPDLPAALAQSPCLLDNRSVFLNLVQNEFREQRAAEAECSPEEYCRRFPGLDQSLLQSVFRLIETEQFLGDNPDLLKLLGAPQWPAPGEVFEGFYLGEELGRGAVSRVFVARQAELGDRQVVLKVTQGLRGEASTLGKLRHPNIVPVYSTGKESISGLDWICMPLLGRYTLAEVIKHAFAAGVPKNAEAFVLAADETRPKAAREAYVDGVIRVAAQVADALAYVHSEGLLHGDLKPSNILLTDDGVPMLIDFNLARDARSESNLIGGTLPYMAPEQLRAANKSSAKTGDLATTASEVFSFGVVLFQMLTGRLPFVAEGEDKHIPRVANRLLEAQANRHAEIASDLAGLDPRVSRLVQDCLQLVPADRPRDCQQVAKRLQALKTRRSKLLSPAYRHPRAAFSTVAVVLLLVGVAVAGFRQASEARTLVHADRLVAAEAYADAVDLLRLYVESNPGELDALRLLARSLLELDDYEAAAEHYMNCWRQGNQPLDVAMVGYCRNLSGDHESAVRLYEEARNIGFSNAAVENNLATSLMKRLSQHFNDRDSKVIEGLYTDAYVQDPKSTTARYNMLAHFIFVQNHKSSSAPSYPVEIASGHADVESCRRAAEFLVARGSSTEVLAEYGLPNLRKIIAADGVGSLSRRLTEKTLRVFERLPDFSKLKETTRASLKPPPSKFLDPSRVNGGVF